MPTHREKVDVEKAKMDEVISVFAEKADISKNDAKIYWKAAMETIHDLLISGKPMMLNNIGRINIAKSKVKEWPGRGITVGGNYIAKMEFYDRFRMEMREAEVDEKGGEV